MPILHIKKLRYRVIKYLSQGHIISNWQNHDQNLVFLTPKFKKVMITLNSLQNFIININYIHISEKAMAPHSSTLAWRIPWMEEPGGLQSMGSLGSDTTERLHFHFSLSCIGEGNGNHSSVLAWRIPGTGEPGGLPSLGSYRVGHD